MGEMKRSFDNGVISDEDVENINETHFLYDRDTHRLLAINYHDVVSGLEGMTVILQISGGINAKLEASLLVFKNQRWSYPIRGCSGNTITREWLGR